MSTVRRSARVAAQKAVDSTTATLSAVNASTVPDQQEQPAKKKSKPSPKIEAKEVSKPAADKMEIGDEIPDISLQDQDEKEISLKDLAAENKILVVFAYPRASTPGCTRQACGFRDNYPILKTKATIVGLSADSPKAQKNFITKQNLPYRLLCDPSRVFIGALGAKKQPSGVIRSHWIFVDGKLAISKVGISPEASINGAKEDVDKLFKEKSKM